MEITKEGGSTTETLPGIKQQSLKKTKQNKKPNAKWVDQAAKPEIICLMKNQN